MPRNRVMVEVDPATRMPIRIIKSKGGALMLPPERVAEWPRKDAVTSIRKQVFDRAGGVCDKCARIVSWDGGHLHERIPRGSGGEISVENCWCLCFDCHILGEHGDRAPQFTK